jgi:hypothetical protein
VSEAAVAAVRLPEVAVAVAAVQHAAAAVAHADKMPKPMNFVLMKFR